MAKKREKRLIIAVLVGLTVAVSVRMFMVENEKRRLNDEYAKTQATLKQLKDERLQLYDELAGIHDLSKTQTQAFAQLKEELSRLQEQLKMQGREISTLRSDYDQLRMDNTSLTSQLAVVRHERYRLEVRLSSLSELKKAISDVKRKMREVKIAKWRERVESLKEEDKRKLIAGNKGFVVHNGKSTLGKAHKLHIHVRDLETR